MLYQDQTSVVCKKQIFHTDFILRCHYYITTFDLYYTDQIQQTT